MKVFALVIIRNFEVEGLENLVLKISFFHRVSKFGPLYFFGDFFFGLFLDLKYVLKFFFLLDLSPYTLLGAFGTQIAELKLVIL
mmetsp:Transcript_15650/g.13697  ORF Transcript_15650/g.13697 Transcript_15650/m.13697 type:complete len:84 (+) Transcript_15650:735-986(+)